MKINITKQEYVNLLTIFEIADWVLQAHKTDELVETRPYRDLEQKLFGFAKDFGCDHLIEYASEHQRYFPTREFEETSPGMDHIQEFENDSFWEELVQRLTDRDLIRQVGEEAFQNLSPEARIIKEEPIFNKYAEEFQANGLNTLEIVSKKGTGGSIS